MSRNLIYTHWEGDLPVDYAHYLMPSFIRYSVQIGCDYKVFTGKHPSLDPDLPPEFHKIGFLSDVSLQYDKIVYVDPDIYVTTFAPNIFEQYDSSDISLFPEFITTLYEDDPQTNYRWRKFKKALSISDEVDSFWGNSGVLRVSSCSNFLQCYKQLVNSRMELFPPVDKSARDYRRVMDNAEPWIAAALYMSGTSVGVLDNLWNCSFHRRKQDKLNAYFVHYNGVRKNKLKIRKDWFRKCYSL